MATLSDKILYYYDDSSITEKERLFREDDLKASIKKLREKLVDGRTMPRVDEIIKEVFGRRLI